MIQKEYQSRYGYLGYGFAVALVIGALLLTQLLGEVLQDTPTSLFFAAVMLSSWYGGWKPGLLATVLSTAVIHYFFLPPVFSLSLLGTDLVLLGIFTGVALLISSLNDARIQVENKLRQSEDYYRLMMEGVQDCEMFVLDTEGYIVRCNAGTRLIKGYRPEELVGQHIYCFYPPNHHSKAQQALETAKLTGRFEEEGWRLRKNGSPFWAHVIITALRDRAGHLRGFFKFTFDTTERKRSEDELRSSLKSLSDIKFALDQAAIVVSTDHRGIITDVNDQFCQLSQYSRDELIGQDHRLINSGYHSPAFFKKLWSTISSGHVWHGEIKNRAKDGSEYWVDTTIVPFLNASGRPFHYLAIRFDITERKQAQADLQIAHLELEQRVERRTAELATANAQLQAEILVRQQVQKSLEQQTAILSEQAQLLELAHDSIIVRTLHDHTITFWNQGAERMYGWSKAEAYGQVSDVLLQTQLPLPRAEIEAILLQRDRWEGEVIHLQRNGTPKTVASRWALQRDPQGNPIAVLEINNDITERKQVEAILQQERQFLDAVLESIEDGIVACDAQGNLSFFNQATRDFHGLPQTSLQPQQWAKYYDLYHPDGQTQMKPEEVPLFRALQGERVQDVEMVIAPKQGRQRILLASGRAIENLQGQKLGAVVSMHDITDYKQTEAKLREYAEQLQQALDFESLLKRITDKVRDSLDEDQILQTVVQELGRGINVRCCDTGLYALNQGTTTISHEYTPGMPSAQGRVLKMIEFPEGYRQLLQGQDFQFCSLDPDSLRGQWAILACPILDDQGVLGDLWLFKYTHLHFSEPEVRLVQQVANQCAIALRQAQLYQEAQAQVEALEHLNRLKDDFLSTVSHELRTPVSNMHMAIRMLQIATQPEQPSPQQRQKATQYLQILDAECQREISLINDLLDLQRLEAGKQALTLETIQIPHWLPRVVNPFQERAQARQQTLVVQLPTGEIPPLVSDVASLERILTELLNNACKYTPPGEEILVQARTEADTVQLEVRNSGTEIPDSELLRIFDKFYRIPSADPWKQGGTGLGLALVKKLTEHLGGIVRVVSGNRQTSFTLELPMQPQ